MAAEAPVVAVFRRGPTNWSHVGQWDLAGLRYNPGGCLRGRIFPRRCDLSPDGQFLAYFAHKPKCDLGVWGNLHRNLEAPLVKGAACVCDMRHLDARVLFFT